MHFLLFTYLAFANPDPEVVKERLPALVESCRKNDGLACGDIGAMYMTGQGLPRDEAKAVEHYEKACKLGQALRCLRVGVMVLNGKGQAASAVKAAELFGMGCKLLDTDSCVNYFSVTHGTKITLDGESMPLPKDLEEPKPNPAMMQNALTALTLACDKGLAKACGNLGGFYEHGEAAGQDFAQALKLYLKACDLGEAERCGRAARYIANGVAGVADKERAAKLFEKFCSMKNLISCPSAHRARAGMDVELKLPKAPGVGTKEEQKTLSYHVREIEKPVNKIPAWALEAPDNLIKGEIEDPELKSLVDACNTGHARSCGNAGGSLVDESGKPKSKPWLARRLFEKACFFGRAQRCADLSRLHANGWGVEKSPERAKAALAEACKLGLKESCAAP